MDLTFRVPGTSTPALSRGLGAVYTDIDTQHTAFEYFDKDGKSLGRYSVPAANNGLSFLGVAFATPVVARVRIEYGTVQLGPDDSATNDVAVMDDFIYGEPQRGGPRQTPERIARALPSGRWVPMWPESSTWGVVAGRWCSRIDRPIR